MHEGFFKLSWLTPQELTLQCRRQLDKQVERSDSFRSAAEYTACTPVSRLLHSSLYNLIGAQKHDTNLTSIFTSSVLSLIVMQWKPTFESEVKVKG